MGRIPAFEIKRETSCSSIMQILESDKKLGGVIPNIALMLERNALRFADKNIFCEKRNGKYEGITWKNFYEDVQTIASNLKQFGFQKGDKMLIYSPNRLEMLQLELAVMSSGGISVPIFAYFHSETAELLIKHSDAKFIAAAGELQLQRLSAEFSAKQIFVFDNENDSRFKNLYSFSELLKPRSINSSLNFDADENEICLNMYTSGTMGVPKCVQLTHRNILSQQAGLEKIWNLNQDDRFLSYLPWHHSFGGIFERFSALYHGATVFLESGYGKDPKIILENWKIVQPTLFFLYPKFTSHLLNSPDQMKKRKNYFFIPA